MINRIKQMVLYAGYLFVVILLTKLTCMVNDKLTSPINVIKLDSSSVITETEKPE